MYKNFASIKTSNVLALVGLFGLIVVAGYSLTRLVSDGNERNLSTTQTSTGLVKKISDLHELLPFGHDSLSAEPTSHAESSNQSHADSFSNFDTNTDSTPKPIASSSTYSKVAPVIPEVTNTMISHGMVPVFYTVNTEQSVVFLTIDDGIVKDPAAITYMAQHHIVASLFLNDSKISDNYDYFKSLQASGFVVENHSLNHLNLVKLNYTLQKKEICDNADKFATVFGKRPTLFRPPYGSFNNITRKAAADCGMKALIHWHAKVNNASVQYQQGNKLQAGDIVLMHFRKEIVADLTAFEEAVQAAKLKPVLLEDWVQ